MDNEILRPDSAAVLLQVTADDVIDLLTRGEIVGRTIRGQWRTTHRALICYLEGIPLQTMCCVPGEDGCRTPPGGCC